MHLLCGADDGIDRASLNAQRAADADLFVDDGDLFGFFFGVERFDLATKQVCQLGHAFLAARRTQVNLGLAFGNGFGVGFAAGVTTLPALRLRQDGFDFFDQWVAFDLELDRGVAQRGAENNGAQRHDEDGSEHYWYLSRPAKPMKARLIKPAVTMAMATPRK